MMAAAVLAGGLGTRLRSVVKDRPKALAPVAGRRFLAYLLDQLADAGLEQVVLCTGYLGEQVQDAFGERWRKLHLRYSQEPEPMGTAGALRYALHSLPTSQVLVLNGDSFCDIDLNALLDFHIRQQANATIALTQVPEITRYGSVKCDSSSAVSGFAEKGSTGPGLINTGVYALDRRLLEAIPAGSQVSLERDCFPQWIGKGLFGFRGGSRFLDIGIPSSFQEAQTFFAPANGFANGEVLRPYALLDRDGTINVERRYLSQPDQLELLPGAIDGMKKLRKLGLGLAIISNQSALGRGYFDTGQLERVHNRLRTVLGEADVAVDGIYYCPHAPEANCDCRKPEVGMVLRAAAELGFVPRDSFVIGDRRCDIELGLRLSATTLLVRTGYGRHSAADGVRADHTVDSLIEAADVIARMVTSGSQRNAVARQ